MDLKIKKEEVLSTLRSKFIKCEDVASALALGYNTNKNVFMYGRGGHAKSEMAEEFLKLIDPDGKESFVQSCNGGLTEEKLFGGINVKKLQDTGEIEYLVKHSFMNYKYVVFEELLDAREDVLLSIKDILTSGRFRQGSQQFKIRTEMVLVLTNRTKQEVAEDDSFKALMERFPIEVKVEWDSYLAKDYDMMFNRVFGRTNKELCVIIEELNASQNFISPRTAVHMFGCFEVDGIESMVHFGLSRSKIAELQSITTERIIIQKSAEYISIKKRQIDDIYTKALEESDVKSIRGFYTMISGEINHLKSSGLIHPEKESEMLTVAESGNEYIRKLKERALNLI